MTIRSKAIITLAVGTGIMMLSSIFFTTGLVGQKMDQLEVKKAILDTERISEAIKSESDNLNSKTADWSIWDDSYKFIEDKNKEYITSNLNNSTPFESLRLSFMIFMNLDNKIVFEKGFNQELKQEEKVPDGIHKYLSELDINNFSGMIMLPEGLYLISSRPILPSSFDGPSKGTIIFGRYFDEYEKENLAKITKHSSVNILPISEDKLSGIETKVIDENNLEGKGIIKDIFDNSIAYYSIIIPRDIHEQRVQGTKYVTSFLIGISITFFIFTFLFLSKFVLEPIKKITKSVNLITHSKDISARINFNGNDEFGLLSKDINIMLGSLELSKDQAFSEAERAKTFFDVVSGIVVTIDKNGNIDAINKKGAQFLGYDTNEIIGKNWIDNFIPQIERESVNLIFNNLIGSKEIKDDSYHENNVLLKTGKNALIGWHNSLLKDQNGNVIATVSHGEDITEKKIEEEKDKKQMEDYERLNQLMMGRELKMVELKKEIEKLKLSAKVINSK